MVAESRSIDLNSETAPTLSEIADSVLKTQRPYRLRRNDRDIALIIPAQRKLKRSTLRQPSQADMDAFWSAFGGWAKVDTEQLKAHLAESRRIPPRPLPEV